MMNGKLTVLTGKQQGAVASLIPGAPITIGSSLEDDIVLRELTINPKHAALLLKDNRMTLSSETGVCLSKGIRIKPGKSCELEDNAQFQLGDVGFSISCPSLSQGPLPQRALSQSEFPKGELSKEELSNGKMLLGTARDTGENVHDNALGGHQHQQSAPVDKKWLPRALTAFALVLCATIVWQSGLFDQQSDEQVVSLQSAIGSLLLAGVSVEQSGASASISGYVDTVQESKKLDQRLAQTGVKVRNNVIVGEAIRDQVIDIFRISKVQAEVQVNHGVDVIVATREAQLDRLKDVEKRILEDVPAIATLKINNDLPRSTEPEANKPAKIDFGKRVAMVVSDEPSFIVTEDQSRYFVGSLLPTGHRIEAISNGVVSVVKNGVSTTLEF